jgi:hypothetical protein
MNRNQDDSWKPTDRELQGKIREFRDLVLLDRWITVDPDQIKRDLDELEDKFDVETWDPKELTKLILTITDEIRPVHYHGQHPPERAYQREIKGESLYPFCWDSACFGVRMYFKFALKGKDKGRKAVLVSIHESIR